MTTVRHFLLFFEAPGLQKLSLKGLPNRSKIKLRVAWGCLGPLGALLGRSWPLLVGFLGAFGALLEALEPQDGAQEAPRRLPGGTPEAKRPSNEPQEASGVRESTGKQLGAPRRNGKRPASARSARARASRENSLNLPPGPPDQGELEKFAAKPPDYGKRERFTAEPPDYGKRERFTAGPPDHEKTRELYRGTTRQTQHTTGHTVATTAS